MPRHMNMRTAIHCLLPVMLLSSLSAVAASIEQDHAAPSRLVKFADLDLTHNAGAGELYVRIESAAREVCDPPLVWAQRLLLAEMNRCRKQAIQRAVADVNAPALTAYHLAKTGEATIVTQRR